MQGSDFIKLTQVLYRVTEHFPEKEPLKFFIREKANEILGDLAKKEKDRAGPVRGPQGLIVPQSKQASNGVEGRILRNIEALEAYFKVAEEQKWVRKENFRVLAKEYNKIGEEIKGLALRGEKGERERGLGLTPLEAGRQRATVEPSREVLPLTGLKQRQRRILQVLGEKQQVQIQDFKEIFPEVTKRTLRRDFDQLLKKGLVKRIGGGKGTFYRFPRTLNRTQIGHK